jgi:hypothetical protein
MRITWESPNGDENLTVWERKKYGSPEIMSLAKHWQLKQVEMLGMPEIQLI